MVIVDHTVVLTYDRQRTFVPRVTMSGWVADLLRDFDADRMLLLFSSRGGGPVMSSTVAGARRPGEGACRVGGTRCRAPREYALSGGPPRLIVSRANFQSRTLKIEQERASGINFGQELVEQRCDRHPQNRCPPTARDRTLSPKCMSTDHPNGTATRSIGKRLLPGSWTGSPRGRNSCCPLSPRRIAVSAGMR